MPWGEGLGTEGVGKLDGRVEKLGGKISQGFYKLKGVRYTFAAHIAHETTRDVVGRGNLNERVLARTGRCNRRWDGGKLEMMQDAPDDRLLSHGGNNTERAASAPGIG